MGAAMAIVESDMVLTLPRRAAKKIAALLPLEVIDAPIDIAPVEVMLLWHERSHRNTEHEWVRSQIAAASHATTPKAPLVDVPKAG
jgi:DNA-binding transcriptional LysR family regulator